MQSRRVWIAAGLAALIAACSGGGPTGYIGSNPPPSGQPPATSTSNSITVQNNRYSPSATTVPSGTTVRWTWDSCTDDGYGGRSCVDHSVTFDADGTGSAAQSTGIYNRQFNTAGTYDYHCTVHGTNMSGRVVVQ